MDHSMPKVHYVLCVMLLLLPATNCVNVYVSSKATKDKNCGGSEDKPCRSIKAAVENAKEDYSQITIMDTKEGYEGCPIHVNRPLAFKGINGEPLIDCKGENAFVFNYDPEAKDIKEKSVIKIDVANLKIQNAKTGFSFLKENKNVHLHLENITFDNNDVDVSWSKAPLCQLVLKNVLAYGSSGNGIEIDRCVKAKMKLENTKFYGKYLKVVSTKEKSELDIDMEGVTFDMSNRNKQLYSTDPKHAEETQSPIHIMTAANQTTLTIQKTEFLNHLGYKNAMVNITSFQKIPTKKNPLRININFYKANFTNNIVRNGSGGAIFFNLTNKLTKKYKWRSIVKFDHCTFTKNSALNGGAVWFSKWDKKTVMFKGCSFKHNKAVGEDAGSGGALFSLGGRLIILDCKFEGNTATKYGGALYLANKKALSMKVTNSVFENEQHSWRNVEGDIMYVDNAQMTFYENILFNLSSSNSGESMFLFEGRPSVLRMSNLSRFICPRGYNYEEAKSTYKTKPARPDYFPAYHIFSFSCKPCQDLFYSTTRGFWQVNGTHEHAKCYKCPYGASCNGTIRARANFWGLVKGDKIEMIPCPKGYCCQHEPCESYDSCDSNRAGTLCAHCAEGFTESMSSTECYPNDKCHTAWWLWPACNVLVIFVFLCFHQKIIRKLRKWFLWDSNEDEAVEYRESERNHNRRDIVPAESNNLLDSTVSNTRESSLQLRNRPNHPGIEESPEYNNSGGYIKIFYYFYQAVLLMRLSSYISTSPVPNQIIDFLTPVLNFQFTNIWSCAGENLRPVRKVLLKNSVAYYVFGLCLVAYIAYRIARNYRGVTTDDEPGYQASNFKVRLVGTVMHVILLSYVAQTQCAVQLLNCVNVGGEKVLHIHGSVHCYGSYQISVWFYFCICILPFPFALLFGRSLLVSGMITWKKFILACFLPLIFLTWWGFKYFRHRRRAAIWSQNPTRNDPYKDKILYILQYPYKTRGSPKARLIEHCRENWETVLMLRRLLLVLVFIFVKSFLFRAYLFFILSILFLTSHIFVKPFANEMVNNLDTISLMLIVLISGLGISEASYNNAGQLIPSSIKTLQILQDYFLAFLPFVLLGFFLTPRARYHIRRYQVRGGRHPIPTEDDSESAVIANQNIAYETSRLT